jgi:hypothetical protein
MERLFREVGRQRARAVAVLPVCNEEERLAACLPALLQQSVSHDLYEVDLLLNHRTAQSGAIGREFQAAYKRFALHIVERTLPRKLANGGTARKMPMDEACLRAGEIGAILSTDGDTAVAPD